MPVAKASNGKRHLELTRRKVGSVMKVCRSDSDLTQAQLGQLIGWSRAKIAKIEGSGRITLASYLAWCEALKLDPLVVLKRILSW